MRARQAIVYSPLLMLCTSGAFAASEQDVLMLLTNPVSTLSRVRADYDSDYDVGEDHEGTRQRFTLRPIIPIPLTDRWQLVSETRIRFETREDAVPLADGNGLGDTYETLFFSPRRQNSAGGSWGLGTLIRMDTASANGVGAGGWGAGPAVILVQQEGHSLSGILLAQLWGASGKSSDESRLEAFATWTRNGSSITFNLDASYDSETQQTLLPVGFSVSHVVRAGSLFVALGARARYYVDVPKNAGAWGLGVDFTIVPGRIAK
jgi:hypothetical protein